MRGVMTLHFFSFVNLSQCQSVKILHLIAHLG